MFSRSAILSSKEANLAQSIDSLLWVGPWEFEEAEMAPIEGKRVINVVVAETRRPTN